MDKAKASRKKQALSQAENAEGRRSGKAVKTEGRNLSFLHNPAVHLALIGILGLLIYSNTFHSPFQWDEADFIVGNPVVRNLDYFLKPSLAEGLPIYKGLKSRYIGYLTFALNYKLNGFDVLGYHIVNLSIHLINAMLVYFLVLLTFRTPYFMARGKGQTPKERKQYATGRRQRSGSQAVDEAAADSITQPLNDSRFTIHDSRSSRFYALAVALLFVAHPIQTEAVTYIFQRLASLVSMFYILSIVLYIKGRLTSQTAEGTYRKSKQYSAGSKQQSLFTVHDSRFTAAACFILSFAAAVLAMKTKENAFTLPLLMALYEFLFFRGPKKARILRLLPFLLTMLVIPATLIGSGSTAGEIVGTVKDPTSLGIEGLSGRDYLFTQFRVIVTYIRLLFLPINQNIDHDYPIYRSFFDPPVLLSFLGLAALAAAAAYLMYKSRREEMDHGQNTVGSQQTTVLGVMQKEDGIDVLPPVCLPSPDSDSPFAIHDSRLYRLVAFGILWFFITLSVESSIIPIPTLIDEYRIYLPSVGFFLAIVAGAGLILRRSLGSRTHASRLRKFAGAALAVVILALSVATFARNTLWKDRVALWEDAAAKSPGSRRVLNNLGLAYAGKGWQEKAISIYRQIIALDPSFPLAYVNLGNAYARTGRPALAIENYEKAVALSPGDAEAYANMARAYGEAGRFEKAAENYTRAVELQPYNSKAYHGLGTAYVLLGRLDDALGAYTKFVLLAPGNPEAYWSRGIVYAKKGDLGSARADFEKSCALGGREGCEYLKSSGFK